MGKRPGIWAESRPEVIEGEFKHPWGTADKLYKGEAIDSFGNRYLLGVFETQDEAAKAFDAWNKEYEEAGAQVQENLRNWAKQQEADLAEEQAAVDEIMADLEKAQSRRSARVSVRSRPVVGPLSRVSVGKEQRRG